MRGMERERERKREGEKWPEGGDELSVCVCVM